MNWALLAATTESARFEPVFHFPGRTEILGLCQDMGIGTAVLLMVMGVVYLMYGWTMYKALVTLNAALVGGYIGAALGVRVGDYLLAGGIMGAVICAGIAWPLMKWSVAVMGAMCGAAVGAGIWMAVGLEPRYAWAGAMTGLVGFGLFSFILFRGSIIVYTSIQGGATFILGLLGLAYKWPDIAPSVSRGLNKQPLMLAVAIILPTVLGLIYQQVYSSAGGGAPSAAKPEAKK